MQCHRHCVWNNILEGVIAVPLKPLGASATAGKNPTGSPHFEEEKVYWLLMIPMIYSRVLCPSHPAGWVTAQHTGLKLLLGTLNSLFFSSWGKQRGIPCCNSFLHRQLLWKSIGLWNFLMWETKDSKASKIKDFQKEQKGRTGKDRCTLGKGQLKADPPDPRMQLQYISANQRLSNKSDVPLIVWESQCVISICL